MTALLLALLGCTPDIAALYEQEKAAALARATGVPAGWSPDLVFAVSDDTLAEATRVGVDAALDQILKPARVELPLGLHASLKPDLAAQSVRLAPSAACAGCFGLDAVVKGRVRYAAGPAEGEVPVTLSVAGEVQVAVVDGTSFTLAVRRVERVKVTAGDLGRVGGKVDDAVADWLADTLRTVRPIPLGALDTRALPVRAVRVATAAEGAALEVLTDLPGQNALARWGWPAEDAALVVSAGALGGLARRAAFEAGTQAMDVAVDPRAVAVDGATFRLDLRVYRLVGRGWWRDYAVTGDLAVERGRVKLAARDAAETAQSAGAGLVDPLAALFEGRVLDAVVDNLHGALPARHAAQAGEVAVTARVRGVEGRDGALVATTELVLEPAP